MNEYNQTVEQEQKENGGNSSMKLMRSLHFLFTITLPMIQSTSLLDGSSSSNSRHKEVRAALEVVNMNTLKKVERQFVSDHFKNHLNEEIVKSVQEETVEVFAMNIINKDDQQIEQLTRVTDIEFKMIYLEIYHFTKANNDKIRRRKLSLMDQLFLWFLYCDNVNEDTLKLIFNAVSASTLRRIADEFTETINAVYQDEISWPSIEERNSLYGAFSVYDKAIGVLDGTHIQIKVPRYAEALVFSGYKRLHTLNYLIGTDALGYIIYLDGPYPGRSNDRTIFNQCKLIKDRHMYFEEGEVLLVDGGFKGEGPILHPFNKVDMGKASEEDLAAMRAYNEEFVLNRSLVEHVIHRIKSRSKILTTRFRRSEKNQGPIVFATVRMYNRILRIRHEYNIKLYKLNNPE